MLDSMCEGGNRCNDVMSCMAKADVSLVLKPGVGALIDRNEDKKTEKKVG